MELNGLMSIGNSPDTTVSALKRIGRGPIHAIGILAVSTVCVFLSVSAVADEAEPYVDCTKPLEGIDVELLLVKELNLDLLNRAPDASVDPAVFAACELAQQETGSPEFIRYAAVAAVLADLPEDSNTWLQRSAYFGSTDAMVLFGLRIIRTDTPLALKYIETGADRGNPAAMVVLALLYDNDSVVPADMDTAVAWLEKAIAKDYAPAKYLLASYLLFGKLPHRDDERAVALLHEAATAGHSGAADLLGTMLSHGVIVQKDSGTAILWLRQAAEAGRRSAMAELALALEENPGSATDDDEAAYWWSQAAQFGMTRENYDPKSEPVRESLNVFF